MQMEYDYSKWAQDIELEKDYHRSNGTNVFYSLNNKMKKRRYQFEAEFDGNKRTMKLSQTKGDQKKENLPKDTFTFNLKGLTVDVVNEGITVPWAARYILYSQDDCSTDFNFKISQLDKIIVTQRLGAL